MLFLELAYDRCVKCVPCRLHEIKLHQITCHEQIRVARYCG